MFINSTIASLVQVLD